MEDEDLRDEYDFSEAVGNPYVSRLKRPITIRLESQTIDYFKTLAQESGIPYQTLMNLFLSQCARERRKPEVSWK